MAIPKGIITLWYGAIIDIPNGYVLCDGTHDTPDLRDKFLVGAGNTYAVDNTGGAVQHNHAFTGDGHAHNISPGAAIAAGADYDDVTESKAVTGTTDNGSSLPPYHALCYIMKI